MPGGASHVHNRKCHAHHFNILQRLVQSHGVQFLALPAGTGIAAALTLALAPPGGTRALCMQICTPRKRHFHQASSKAVGRNTSLATSDTSLLQSQSQPRRNVQCSPTPTWKPWQKPVDIDWESLSAGCCMACRIYALLGEFSGLQEEC